MTTTNEIESAPPAGPKPLGRKPDPGLEDRVMSATVAVYGEVGWAALTIDAVARRARAGKAAIYSRWGTRQGLLQAALTVRPEAAVQLAGQDIHEAFLQIAGQLIDGALGPWGLAMSRINVEVRIYPEVLGPVRDSQRVQLIEASRQIVARGMENGDLLAGTSPSLVFDALAGSIDHHVAQLPSDRLDEFLEHKQDYVERVVDFVLANVMNRKLSR